MPHASRLARWVLFLLMLAPVAWQAGGDDGRLGAQQTARGAVVDSSALARQFVQAFYTEYTPLAHRPDPFPAYYHVLGRTRPVLTATLAAALRADSARRVRGGFRVAVRPRCADLRGQQDPVVVTVTVEQGTLRIANVAGPTIDLLRLLCVYAARGTVEGSR